MRMASNLRAAASLGAGAAGACSFRRQGAAENQRAAEDLMPPATSEMNLPCFSNFGKLVLACVTIHHNSSHFLKFFSQVFKFS